MWPLVEHSSRQLIRTAMYIRAKIAKYVVVFFPCLLLFWVWEEGVVAFRLITPPVGSTAEPQPNFFCILG